MNKYSKPQIKRISSITDELSRRILLACDNFDPSEREQRIRNSKNDLAFFARTYLPHHIRDAEKVGLSEFHKWIAKRWCDFAKSKSFENLAVAAPRGEAKSTYLLSLSLWCYVFGHKKFIIYIMDTLEQAQSMLDAFADELLYNQRLKQDLPNITKHKDINIKKDKVLVSQRFCIVAKGAKQRIRGLKFGAHRPDLIILDDIENDLNVRTRAQRDRLQDWLEKAVQNLGEAGSRFGVLCVGTILHNDSLLARLLSNPLWESKRFSAIPKMPEKIHLWQEWENILKTQGKKTADSFYRKNKTLMDKGSIINWPQKRSLLELMTLKANIGHFAFQSEQQNRPSESEYGFDKMVFWEKPCKEWIMIGAVDPSLGRAGGDPSAIIVGGINRQIPSIDIVEAIINHSSPDDMIKNIISLQKHYEIVSWYVENIQFQEFLRHEIVTRATREGVPLSAVPVTPKAPKDLRIDALRAPVLDGRIRFSKQHTTLIQQLRDWPLADHDDGPDALAMLWKFGLPAIIDSQFSQMNDTQNYQKLKPHQRKNSFMEKQYDDDINPQETKSW